MGGADYLGPLQRGRKKKEKTNLLEITILRGQRPAKKEPKTHGGQLARHLEEGETIIRNHSSKLKNDKIFSLTGGGGGGERSSLRVKNPDGKVPLMVLLGPD